MDNDTLILIVSIITAVAALASAIGACWSANTASRAVDNNPYNNLLNGIIKNLEELENISSEYWHSSNLEAENRKITETKIKSLIKGISNNLTIIGNKYKKKFGDTQNIIQEMNEIRTEITGGKFEDEYFKPDNGKAVVISNLICSFRKSINEKII